MKPYLFKKNVPLLIKRKNEKEKRHDKKSERKKETEKKNEKNQKIKQSKNLPMRIKKQKNLIQTMISQQLKKNQSPLSKKKKRKNLL